ncbi:MFS transporter [Melghirimyces algeriensis]|uniref:MFS-type transporter involved in bile tolerance, Atg22 family n=1 Tax=Melghirimyces algeriensis TaxID=910412 RepID=A0A521EXU9_9BACL|nr:MFS transporter [Melghirimyces algeriensis]SMO88713.1 MFS-type transporter involved in bile tolerance, Atg22 family [Melghirimyces algeriensis]
MNSIWKERRIYILLMANIASSVGTGISGIAVPWFLIQRSGGEAIYGYLMFGMTVVSFLLSPTIGVWVDRVSRKRLLLWNQCFGMMVTFPLALWGFTVGHFEIWQLVAVSASSFLYYTLHFPAQFALVQEIFDRSQYSTLNSLLEVQSQAAAVISGGLASLLLDRVGLDWILFLDFATYLLSFLLLWRIPYSRKSREDGETPVFRSWWGDFLEGYQYLRTKPMLTLFFLCTLFPFIGVMASNYLNPIYVVKTLNADATVMGLQEIMYAVGAVAAGVLIPWFVRRLGPYATLLTTVGCFVLATAVLAFVPMVMVFLMIKLLFGVGNAGTRVVRKTLMMEKVPNRLIGRVNSFFMGVGYILRIVLLGLFTEMVPEKGAMWAYAILLILMVAAWIGIAASRNVLKNDRQYPNYPIKMKQVGVHDKVVKG